MIGLAVAVLLGVLALVFTIVGVSAYIDYREDKRAAELPQVINE